MYVLKQIVLFQSLCHSPVISSRTSADYHKKTRTNLTGHDIITKHSPALQGQNKLTLETGISTLKLQARIDNSRQGLLDLIYYHSQLTYRHSRITILSMLWSY